jgi:hypothetical protein
MKTNSNLNIVLGLLASIASLTVGCGSDGSSSDGAATGASTEVSSLAINLDGVSAVATEPATQGEGLRLADDNAGKAYGLDKNGKVKGNLFTSDDPYFMSKNVVVAGDGSILVAATTAGGMTTDANGNITKTVRDTKLPGGKKLKEDCSGQFRVKNGTVSCLVTDASDLRSDDPYSTTVKEGALTDFSTVLTDKSGNVFVNSYDGSVYRISPEGVAKDVTNKEAELLAATDNGTAVVLMAVGSSSAVRLYTTSGSSKTIAGTFQGWAGDYVVTSDGVYGTDGAKLEISGLANVGARFVNLNETEMKLLDQNGQLTMIDLAAKTAVVNTLTTSNEILMASFVGSDLYYGTAEGVTKVESATGLATTSLVETKVQGLSDISIFSMTKVGDRVLFSGQSDSNSGYVTGAIEGIQATVNTADSKITSIQSL